MFNFLSGGRARTSNRTRRSRQPEKRQSTLEHLENRALLSQLTAVVANGELYINDKTPTAPVTVAIVENSNNTATVTPLSGTTLNGPLTNPQTFGPIASMNVNLSNSKVDNFVFINGDVPATPKVHPQVTNVSVELGTGGGAGSLFQSDVVIGGSGNVEGFNLNDNGIVVSGLTITSQDSGAYSTTYVDVYDSVIAGLLKVSLGDAPGDSVYLSGNGIAKASVSEGSGKHDSIYSTDNTYGGAGASFTQGSGKGDTFSSIDDVQLQGNFTIVQGDGSDDCVEVIGLNSSVSSSVTLIDNLSITQGDGKQDSVYVDDSYIGGSLSITQNDTFSPSTPYQYDQVNVDDTSVGKNLTITQSDGWFDTVEVGFFSPVTVGKNLTISQGNGFEDEAFVEDTTVGYNLTINQGDGNADVIQVAAISPVSVGNNLNIHVTGTLNFVILGTGPATLTAPDGTSPYALVVGNELTVFSGQGGDQVFVDNTWASSSSFTDVALPTEFGGAGDSVLYDSGGNAVPFFPEPVGLVGNFAYEFSTAFPVFYAPYPVVCCGL